jgi:RNA 2',3'-cyclic 3'-phosphodiesterase
VRLFVALEIPSEVRNLLAAWIKNLSAVQPSSAQKNVRWVRPENLHVTLKFIGEIPVDKLDSIQGELNAVGSDHLVELRFRGVGFFPSERRPRVLWVGMEASPNLASLAGEIEQRLEKLGIERERRPFTPHLTLARFDPPGISERLRNKVQENLAYDFGLLRTSEFHLIQSKLKPTGAEYTALQSFRFAAEA